MEYSCLEVDEIYEAQCGEVFFTSKCRLIFHCTLCEKMFDAFDIYELHLKEHIPNLYEESEANNAVTENGCFENDHERSSTYTNNVANLTLDEDDQIYDFENQEPNFGDHNEICEKFDEKQEILELDQTNQTSDEEYLECTIPIDDPISTSNLEVSAKQKNVQTELAIVKEVKSSKKSQKRKRFSQQLKNEIFEYKERFQENNSLEAITDKHLEIPTVVRAVKSCFSRQSKIPDEERKHKCPVCGAAFKEKHNMIHHLKRHSDRKDHKCPVCDKCFFTTSEVNGHLKSHNKERPYLCSICGKSFAYKNQMLTHIKRHTNQKNHKCDICGKAFFDRYLLKNHMAGHSSERPFSCANCSAAFTRRRTLINHVKLHQNKREYKCGLCNLRFNQKAGVNSHMRSAHKTTNAHGRDNQT